MENRHIAESILSGAKGPRRDIVLVNASAALVAAGRTGDLREGVEIAARSIDSGSAGEKLAALARFTNSYAFVQEQR